MVIGRRCGYRRSSVGAVLGLVMVLVALLAIPPRALGAPVDRLPAAGSDSLPDRSAALNPTGAIPALPAASTYVRDLYLAVLGREPSRQDLRTWGVPVDAGFPPSAVVAMIIRSPEWTTARVRAIYEQLGRPADPGGLSYWVSRIRAGDASIEQATALILGSTEYFRRAGGTNERFLAAVYSDVLGRSADAGGVAHWLRQLDAGRTRGDVVRGLVRSPERAHKLLAATVRKVLDRRLMSGDLVWIAGYTAGSMTEATLLARVAGSAEAVGAGCDPTVSRACMLPFPNDQFTVPDRSTVTGRRVGLKPQWTPRNKSGVPIDPTEWNRNDGFSPGQAALVHAPGIDLQRSGAVPINDIARHEDADAPIVVLDTVSGERWPIWAELDANTPETERPEDQLLLIRPARNWIEGHRYIVVMRNLRDATGSPLPAPKVFARYRDKKSEPGHVGGFERRRAHYESMFEELAGMGVERSSLYLAWDFTVASMENIAGRMVTIRDDAFGRTSNGTPSFSVTSVQEAPDPGVLRRVEGQFKVPQYLTDTGGPGSRQTTAVDGQPAWSGKTYTASFTCLIPSAATQTPSRPVVYGHGLLGGRGEVNSGSLKNSITAHNFTYCATDWLGMATEDLGNTVGILTDLSRFPQLADRTQQGILDFLFLARLLASPTGFAADPAFRAEGEPLVDSSAVFYDGNSQGGIMGGALMAVSTDIRRGVLGVPGMNYSTLLERSVDFDPFYGVFAPEYPDRAERSIGIAMIQMLWDRGEANGYAAHMTDDPLPGTPEHQVLLQVALGDHQVAPVTAEVEARTIGATGHQPAYLPGRTTDVTPLWGIRPTVYPSTGSAIVFFDSGAPLAPTANVPPREGEDPHSDPRADPEANVQKSEFLRVGGTVIDVCGGQPCTAEPR